MSEKTDHLAILVLIKINKFDMNIEFYFCQQNISGGKIHSRLHYQCMLKNGLLR